MLIGKGFFNDCFSVFLMLIAYYLCREKFGADGHKTIAGVCSVDICVEMTHEYQNPGSSSATSSNAP